MSEEEPIVFVVDDDVSVRNGLKRLIRSVGLEVETFASAQEFLDHDHPDRPSCLVLDVRMPGLSGLDLRVLAGRAEVRRAATACGGPTCPSAKRSRAAPCDRGSARAEYRRNGIRCS